MKYNIAAGNAMTTGVAIGVAMTVCLVAIVGIAVAALGRAPHGPHRPYARPVITYAQPATHPTKCFDCERQLGAHYRNVSPQVSHGYPEVSVVM